MYALLNLLLFCVFNNCCYYIYPYFLSLNSNYNILKDDKKIYVIKNVIKSVNLLLLITQTNNLISFIKFNKHLSNNFVNNFASFYVSNDIVALYRVKKLPSSTLFHHIMTTILLFVSYNIDFENLEDTSLAKLLIVYTCFSCYPFTVNSYLGLRFLEYKEEKIKINHDRNIDNHDRNIDNQNYTQENKENCNNELKLTKLTSKQLYFNIFLEILRQSSFWIYMICIICNWTYQIFNLIINPFTLGRLIYVFCMFPIVNDDIVLLSWLKKKHK